MDFKFCKKCQTLKTTSDFTKHSKTFDGLYSSCRDCKNNTRVNKKEPNEQKRKRVKKLLAKNPTYFSDYNREYYKKNPEKAVARRKKYVETGENKIACQRRRAKKKNLISDFTKEQWTYCLEYFNNCCAYCGLTGDLEQEHVIPVDKGGHYTYSNIVPSCSDCNTRKHTKNMEIWFKQQIFYSDYKLNKIYDYLKNTTF